MIPPPRRILQQADLAGEWKRGNGAVASYATSNGSYAGFDSVSIGTAWNIDDSGGLHEKFTAAYSGYSSGHAAVQENNVGTFTIDNRNIVRLYRPAQNGNRESTDFYIVVGWFVGPEMIIMKLNGPYHGSITEKDISNASVNMYNSIPYVKKR
jgi:hypothetical protein